CDVHLTADGVPVLCHDPWVETAAGIRPLRDLTAAECLRPALAVLYEFVRAYRSGVIIDVEVKRYPYEEAECEQTVRQTEQAVLEVIRSASLAGAAELTTRVRSFD